MQKVSPYIYQTILTNNIVYTDNIVVSIVRLDEPFGVSWAYRECYAEGLRQFEIMVGYMEVVDVGKVLREAGINAKAIFYGMEEITTKNPIWKFFALIKRITPSYIHFYKLPPDPGCTASSTRLETVRRQGRSSTARPVRSRRARVRLMAMLPGGSATS